MLKITAKQAKGLRDKGLGRFVFVHNKKHRSGQKTYYVEANYKVTTALKTLPVV